MHFAAAGSKGFLRKHKKNFDGLKVSNVRNNSICFVQTTVLLNIDLKRSLGRCFHGPNFHAHVTGHVHAFSSIFFPFNNPF